MLGIESTMGSMKVYKRMRVVMVVRRMHHRARDGVGMAVGASGHGLLHSARKQSGFHGGRGCFLFFVCLLVSSWRG